MFVFAVQTCKDPAAYDALNTSQWAFYVVPAGPVRDSGYKTISIAWVRRRAEPVDFAELATAVEVAGTGSARP